MLPFLFRVDDDAKETTGEKQNTTKQQDQDQGRQQQEEGAEEDFKTKGFHHKHCFVMKVYVWAATGTVLRLYLFKGETRD